MSTVNSKVTMPLFAVLVAGFLAAACSSEATGPSQGGGSSSVQSDSTRPSFGWHGGP
jgi:outer membrane murein-binding lipoprotein Lpp